MDDFDLLDVLGPVVRKAPLPSVEEKRDNVASTAINSPEDLQATVASLCMSMPIIRDVLQGKYVNSKGKEICDKTKVCKHQVAFPSSMRPIVEQLEADDAVFTLPRPETMAQTYPFELDPFQVQAVSAVDREESVLVSAHTSAGKTVVAEYAIAHALAKGQKIVYTSPIKALSNQKFHDLSGMFPTPEDPDRFVEVGLMTGDTTIAPHAPILVMTTEILREQLYSGSELMREMKWVIFDEVHYMRDSERGVVWEETMIKLRPGVKCVFLSATIPNAPQFAGWIAQLRNEPCHVIYTEYRPTPLSVFIPKPKTATSNGFLRLIKEGDAAMNAASFNSAMTDLAQTPQGRNGTIEQLKTLLVTLIGDGGPTTFGPVIVFGFGKREIQGYADDMMKAMSSNGRSWTTPDDVTRINFLFNKARDTINEEDRSAMDAALPLLRMGLGVHHSGLLPTMKEITEMLFGLGLLKVLFATETFAMGLNMPARTVIFSSVTKWDGEGRRILSSGEYTQMAGRAGRRNADKTGNVIIMASDRLDRQEFRIMVERGAEDLHSAFHLSYNMLLKMLRQGDGEEAAEMLGKSFLQYQQQCRVPPLIDSINAKLLELGSTGLEGEGDAVVAEVGEYTRLLRQLTVLRHGVFRRATQAFIAAQLDKAAGRGTARSRRRAQKAPAAATPQTFLTKRLVFIDEGDACYGWGLVLGEPTDRTTGRTVQVLVRTDEEGVGPAVPGAPGTCTVVSVGVAAISVLGGHVSGVVSADSSAPDYDRLRYAELVESRLDAERGAGGDPLPGDDDGCLLVGKMAASLHSFLDKDLSDEYTRAKADFVSTVSRLAEIRTTTASQPDFDRVFARVWSRDLIQAELAALGAELHALSDETVLTGEMERMTQVLTERGYIDSDGVLSKLGTFAAEVNTANELLVTELLVTTSVFTTLSPVDVCGLLGALIDETKAEEEPKLPSDALAAAIETARERAKDIGDTMARVGVETTGEEYRQEAVRLGVVPLIHAWANGSTLAKTMLVDPEAFPGGLVRVLRRLAILLQQMVKGCSKIGGMDDLKAKFEEARGLVWRGVVCQPSLYMTNEQFGRE
ncbi:DSHCT (NUC185) domain [Carpediemonas membranifera]|uniref:DSHCT (NUC185) domain n=1 Tax=Carpediemonas membranifera TaxID=201153 RepID=A0A8J6B6S2_9EUKA|nr:DSHCT (NUC185) domain [Carpediemonas membranifera]|eukprot:KAG9394259.1 DSHCT (NUC185) domain [Carpediemonas membranifera]